MKDRPLGSAQGGAVMTFREIGQEMGITEEMARYIFHRALSKLRRRAPRALELMAQLGEALEDARIERVTSQRELRKTNSI